MPLTLLLAFEDVSGRWIWNDVEVIRVYREGERGDSVPLPWLEFIDRKTGRVLMKTYRYGEGMSATLVDSVLIMDFDGDGVDEILLTFSWLGSAGYESTYIMEREGDGIRVVFHEETLPLDTIVDMDGDGDLELVMLGGTFFDLTCNACAPIYYLVYAYSGGRWKCSRRLTMDYNLRRAGGSSRFSPSDSVISGRMALRDLQKVTFLLYGGRKEEARRLFLSRWRGDDAEQRWERLMEDMRSDRALLCIYPWLRER